MRSSEWPEAIAISAGASEGQRSAVRSLLSLLRLACGSSAGALGVLNSALQRAGREELPHSCSDLVAFVHDHLLEVLTDEVGPRLATALGDDLAAELRRLLPRTESRTTSSVAVGQRAPREPALALRPASGALSIALIDPDRVARAALARALVRERWNVKVPALVEPGGRHRDQAGGACYGAPAPLETPRGRGTPCKGVLIYGSRLPLSDRQLRFPAEKGSGAPFRRVELTRSRGLSMWHGSCLSRSELSMDNRTNSRFLVIGDEQPSDPMVTGLARSIAGFSEADDRDELPHFAVVASKLLAARCSPAPQPPNADNRARSIAAVRSAIARRRFAHLEPKP